MAPARSPSSAATMRTGGRCSGASTSSAKRSPHRAEQELAGLGQPAADHDDLGVEDVHQVGDAEGDPPANSREHRQRAGVALPAPPA